MKKLAAQCAIQSVVARSNKKQPLYLHKESNPDKVYFDHEHPEIKEWCKRQTKRLKKRDC